MKVLNIHKRKLDATVEQVGALIDSLASEEDSLWPSHSWPPMTLDRPLGVGASGGHGPIGYDVEEYEAGRSIQFRFTRPKGFAGYHRFEIVDHKQNAVVLRHTIDMSVHGVALLAWPLIIRPMHDALLEDLLATAQASLGLTPQMQAWSLRVKLTRLVLSGGKIRSQATPKKREMTNSRGAESGK